MDLKELEGRCPFCKTKTSESAIWRSIGSATITFFMGTIFGVLLISIIITIKGG